MFSAAALPLLVAACSSDGAVGGGLPCDPSLQPVTLEPLQGTTAKAADFGQCLQLTSGGRYLVVPQFASEGPEGEQEREGFLIAAADEEADVVAAAHRRSLAAARNRERSPAARFHMMLREQEAELAAQLASRRREPSMLRAQVAAGAPAASREFKVLSNLNGREFATVTASLKYEGSNIYIYVDDETPGAPAGFDDATWQAYGKVFNDRLFAIATDAFGSVSDIDANDHVIVLFTPVVNALTKPSDPGGCDFYVAGFFTGFDLTSTGSNSNRGEVFYSSAPAPQTDDRCGVSRQQVNYLTPATFIHELQHMISYNEHVLVRGGREENVWLNEGLSLIAEELAGKSYEQQAGQPRTDPAQLFPDSAQGFLVPNLEYLYDYLRAPTDSASVTTFADFGSVYERGAAWFFLRWLGDLKGEGIYRSLVQTNLRGIANVAQQAGEEFPRLFGDFGIAAYIGDSLPGLPRTAIPERYRIPSRNFRAIYGRFAAETGSDFPLEYPAVPTELFIGDGVSSDMPLGTMDFYAVEAPGTTSPITVRFSTPGRAQLAGSTRAQVSIFRLPEM
jgi:hypothetical protein